MASIDVQKLDNDRIIAPHWTLEARGRAAPAAWSVLTCWAWRLVRAVKVSFVGPGFRQPVTRFCGGHSCRREALEREPRPAIGPQIRAASYDPLPD